MKQKLKLNKGYNVLLAAGYGFMTQHVPSCINYFYCSLNFSVSIDYNIDFCLKSKLHVNEAETKTSKQRI